MKLKEELRGMELDRKIRIILFTLATLMLMLGCITVKTGEAVNNDVCEKITDSPTPLYDYDMVIGPINITLMNEQTAISEDSITILSETSGDIDIVEEYGSFKEVKPVPIYNEHFTGNTDIKKGMSGVTAEMLDEATEYFQQFQDFDNPFKGKGWIFIEAQEKSGLDALWIYSLAVFESGWGTSKIAKERSNYFGIGAWDTDLNRSEYMGNDLYSGIINGAIWISKNYYEEGQTTTALMNSVPAHSYAPGNKVWVSNVVDFVNMFYDNWRVI